MRRLYISIILTVMGSLFFISWGLDRLVASNTANNDVYEESNELQLYKQLLDGLTQQLNDNEVKQIEFIVDKFQNDYKIKVNIEAIINVALPKELVNQLSSPGGLFLASDNNSYLLKRINNHPTQLLQMHLPEEAAEDNSLDIILTLTLYLGVGLIVILWLLPLTRRLYLLNHLAIRIGEGHFSERVSKSRFSYIAMLENGFNRMAAQIEKLIADNKLLARSLSHDIRTPIACLRFGIEAAIDSQNISKKDQYLHRMEKEISRMEEMTSAFLEYAGLERQGFHLRPETLSVNELIKSVADNFQLIADKKNITLHCVGNNKPAVCKLDFHWCYRAIQNLVSNAIQYAESEVKISLQITKNDVEIIIEDDGKGISQTEREKIFQPFVKLDGESSREDGHFGLGLAIVAKVADWHNATVIIEDSVSYSGACFKLRFTLLPL
jgi:signal transduction histidine kinase